LTLEGLADVEGGYVIEHRIVKAWADSLGTAKELPAPQPTKPCRNVIVQSDLGRA
jgi:hypothetical protein